MLRFASRVLATFALAAAVVAAVLDATRSITASQLVLTPLATSWRDSFPAGFERARETVEAAGLSFLWDPILLAVMGLPGFAVFLALAFLFFVLGRRPRHRIGGHTRHA